MNRSYILTWSGGLYYSIISIEYVAASAPEVRMFEGFKVSSGASFFKVRVLHTCQLNPGYFGVDKDRLSY